MTKTKKTKEPKQTKVWVSALVPRIGADTYDGVRVCATFTERDCYEELCGFLDIEFESVEKTKAALDEALENYDDSYGVEAWKVEEQTIFS